MFTLEDLKEFKKFRMIVNQSDIKIKGEAAVMVASSFLWFNSLEKRFQEAIDAEGQLSSTKMKRNPIKKVE